MQHKHFIDGQWVDSQGGGEMAILNPATGKQIATRAGWLTRRCRPRGAGRQDRLL